MVSRDVPIGQRFFDAMDKTERIRQDCQVLMAGEEGPTQAGWVIWQHIAFETNRFSQIGHHGSNFFVHGTGLREDIPVVLFRIPSDGQRGSDRSQPYNP